MGSKKLPPLKPPNALLDGCGVARVLVGALPKLANGSAATGLAMGAAVLDMLRLLKASLNPPIELCGWWLMLEDPMPPKAPCCWLFCWFCAGATFGADAYSERMDCFKSGRDWAAPVTFPGVLAGLGGAAGSPKKSKPSNESLIVVAFGGAGAAFVAGGPEMPDRDGAGSEAPIRSIWAGWLL